jgi:pyruvate dehydrogenase E2 component (dihydrolipoamide acetyltransferase)
MPFTLTMPKLSPTMEEGTIAKWHKREGEFVESGDLLLEVATDKATVEHTAIDSGWLRKILIPDGEAAIVNQPIAIFTEEEKESFKDYKPVGETPKTAQEPAKQPKESSPSEVAKPVAKGEGLLQPAFVPEAPLQNYEFEYPTESSSKRILASPLARKLAKEKKLDLSTIKGTGPGHRIMKRDLEKAQPVGQVVIGQRKAPKVAPGTFFEESMTPMRKVIGQRLQESKTFIPHFYVEQTIDASALVDFREQLRNLEIKVSVNDCVVRACALALKLHPIVNSGFNSVNNTIIRYQTIDISIAVSLEAGLITPIVRQNSRFG